MISEDLTERKIGILICKASEGQRENVLTKLTKIHTANKYHHYHGYDAPLDTECGGYTRNLGLFS